jgi:predicted DNA-binding protein (UPF0251 family)
MGQGVLESDQLDELDDHPDLTDWQGLMRTKAVARGEGTTLRVDRKTVETSGTARGRSHPIRVATGGMSKARRNLAQLAAELAVRRVLELLETEATRIAGDLERLDDPARQLTVIFGRERGAAVREANTPQAALEQAFVRADQRKAAILRDPAMLTGEAAAERLGVSRETINRRAQQGRLLALEFAKRGKRYPEWQFEESVAGRPLESVLAALGSLGDWERYRFFTKKQPELGDRTPVDALRGGAAEAVRSVALGWAAGEQGGG